MAAPLLVFWSCHVSAPHVSANNFAGCVRYDLCFDNRNLYEGPLLYMKLMFRTDNTCPCVRVGYVFMFSVIPTESRNHRITESRNHGITESRNHGITESRHYYCAVAHNNLISDLIYKWLTEEDGHHFHFYHYRSFLLQLSAIYCAILPSCYALHALVKV